MLRVARLLVPLALCCAAALPAAASATPRASDFEMRVRAPSGAHAASAHRTWTSRPIQARARFSVFGLKWRRASDHLTIRVRVRDHRGWHRWTTVPHAHSANKSDPVWAGRSADAVQLKITGRVSRLRVHFVTVHGRESHKARAAQSGGPPPITPRSAWGGDTQCKPRDPASLGTVQMAFVHHTVNANDYGPADSAGMVLGICRYHRNSNGWDDIGYNFLVDKYGQIFEGRAGGIDQPVIGAQAQGWNSQSTGIANLGTYQDVPQTPQAMDAMARLIAWKLPLHGAPVTGTVTLRSGGGSSNRYPSGALHTFERISGHRDGNQTECPGAQLYAQLPALRAQADRLAPDVIPAPQPVTSQAKLSLTANRLAFSYPEPAQLAGRFTTPEGAPIAGTPVRIQVLTARGFKAVQTTTTAADGAFTASLPTSRNRSVRALVGKVVSNTVRLRVSPSLNVHPDPPRRVLAGRRWVIKGKLRPRKGTIRASVYLQRGEKYRFAKRVRIRARQGRFRSAIKLGTPGLYKIVVRFTGDRRNAPARADYYVRAVRKLSSVGAVPAAR